MSFFPLAGAGNVEEDADDEGVVVDDDDDPGCMIKNALKAVARWAGDNKRYITAKASVGTVDVEAEDEFFMFSNATVKNGVVKREHNVRDSKSKTLMVLVVLVVVVVEDNVL